MQNNFRYGLTMVELLACVGIVATLSSMLVTGVYWARESSRITSCKNNLHQISTAANVYQMNRRAFPAGRNAENSRQHSWGTALLPFLEQEELYFAYDFSLKWNHDKNQSVTRTDLPFFRCPSTDKVCDGQSDYAGNYGSTLTGLTPGFKPNQAWSSGILIAVNLPGNRQKPVTAERVRDGLSHTLLVVESSGLPLKYGGGWSNGHRNISHDSGRVNQYRSSRIFADHHSGANVAMGDGSVHLLSPETDLKVIGALSTRANGDRTDSM